MDHIVRSIENIKSVVESMDDVMEDTVQQFHNHFVNDVFDGPYFQDSDVFTYPTIFTTQPTIIKNTIEKYRRKYDVFKFLISHLNYTVYLLNGSCWTYLYAINNILRNHVFYSVGSKDAWWYPKPENQKGKIWINNSTSQTELDVVGVIANLCLIEVCIGSFARLFISYHP